MAENVVTKTVSVGDFLKLKVERNGTEEYWLVEIIKRGSDQSLTYWSSLGIRRASEDSPLKALIGKEKDSRINIDTPSGKTNLTILSILNSDEVRETLELIKKELEPNNKISEENKAKVLSLFN